jgi:hypothetical protein
MLADPQSANYPNKFAENIVRQYIGYYFDFATVDLSTDISALRLGGHFSAVVDAINKFTTILGVKKEFDDQKESRRKLNAIEVSDRLDRIVKDTRLSDEDEVLRDAIVLAHREAQGYKREQHTDLWDFCNCLSERLKDKGKYKDVRDACIAIRDAIDPLNGKQGDALVLRSGYSGAAFQYSNGLSVFFPWANLTDAAGTEDLDHYGLLGFATATLWDEFLRVYLHATKRRPPRDRNTQGDLLTSMLNRRTGIFTGEPGAKDSEVDPVQRDSEVDPVQRTTLVTARIESMKNPPTEWKQCKI